jgi:hypothetical protein
LRTWPIAITLMSCTVLNVPAKSAPVPVNGAPNSQRKITIPVTTSLTVKLDQVVSAKTAGSDGGFTVTFSEPVTVDGVVVIPVGANRSWIGEQERSKRRRDGIELGVREWQIVPRDHVANHFQSEGHSPCGDEIHVRSSALAQRCRVNASNRANFAKATPKLRV